LPFCREGGKHRTGRTIRISFIEADEADKKEGVHDSSKAPLCCWGENDEHCTAFGLHGAPRHG